MQTTLVEQFGRIHPRVYVPSPFYQLYLYTDASGRADHSRIWGTLAVLGQKRNAELMTLLAELRRRNPHAIRGTGEIKGSDLDTREAEFVRASLVQDGVMFWANCYSKARDPELKGLHGLLGVLFRRIRAKHGRVDSAEVNSRYDEVANYYELLKQVNKHKLTSLVAHFQWLFNTLHHFGAGSQFRQVEANVDEENFPEPREECGWLLKILMASSLQSAGMSYRLTGGVIREKSADGAVTVNVSGDSSRFPGLQLVDVLLNRLRHRVPGFSATRTNAGAKLGYDHGHLATESSNED